ncbi:MAG: molybdopterin-guanine dinucleotide biosynthesis protein B [Acidobacteriia bacterium]|nr:molybdopterin-guanine dinucleotide biosynthesis protein B [Terriglobia bacterium]
MSVGEHRGYQRYSAPVLAVCGYSGSGKTTLLAAAIPRLVAQGLSVAVVKHDAHGAIVDTPGKDSDRLFQAGATVALRGPDQQFQRRRTTASLSLQATLAEFSRDHDLLLVEGHKDTPLPKFWLESSPRIATPENVTNIIATLKWDSQRLEAFLGYIHKWLPQAWADRPLYRGLLVSEPILSMEPGKKSPNAGHQHLAEIVAALRSSSGSDDLLVLGTGSLPESLRNISRLPDVPGFGGPCASLIAAHRWLPEAAWMMVSCDFSELRAEDIQWLAAQRRPGTWAVIPRDDGHGLPALALYEPQALAALERQAIEDPDRRARLVTLLDHPRTQAMILLHRRDRRHAAGAVRR